MEKEKLSFIERFFKFYPKFIDFLSKLTNINFSVLNLLISTLGILVVLILGFYFEYTRVLNGFLLIKEADYNLAQMGSIFFIALNVVSEVMYANNKYHEQDEEEEIFTVTKLLYNVFYFLGLVQLFSYATGNTYKKKYKKQSASFLMLVRAVTLSIIFVAFLGGMIEFFDLPEYQGLNTLEFIEAVFAGDAKNVLILLSGVMVTITSVFAVQIMTGYIVRMALQMNDYVTQQAQSILEKENYRKTYTFSVAKEKFTQLQEFGLSDEWELEEQGNKLNLYNERLDIQSDFKTIGRLANWIRNNAHSSD